MYFLQCFRLETFLRRIPTRPEISEILAKVPEFCSRSENSVRNYQIHEELQRKANKVKQQLAKRRLRSWAGRGASGKII
jgi:hypothetical protein